MNLLFYTEKLRKKIKFYDDIAKKGLNEMQSNPFFRPKNITIVWIEEERE